MNIKRREGEKERERERERERAKKEYKKEIDPEIHREFIVYIPSYIFLKSLRKQTRRFIEDILCIFFFRYLF